MSRKVQLQNIIAIKFKYTLIPALQSV